MLPAASSSSSESRVSAARVYSSHSQIHKTRAHYPTESPRMDKSRKKMTERILNLTLEIICLLTGEDYTVVKKTSGECLTPSSHPYVSGHRSHTKNPTSVPPPKSLKDERNNEQKILELTNKIIELLTGEDWDYLEGEDLYKKVNMEDHQPLTSPVLSAGGSMKRNSPERYHTLLPSQDSSEEDLDVPDDTQDEDLIDIKVEVIEEEEEEEEEMYMMGDQQCKEEQSPVEISPSGSTRRKKVLQEICPSPVNSPGVPEEEEDLDVQPGHQDEDLLDIKVKVIEEEEEEEISMSRDRQFKEEEVPVAISANMPSALHSKDPQCNPSNSEEHSVDTSADHIGGNLYPCSECGKYFKKKANLIRHQRIHTGEKPFPCSECGKCFTQKCDYIQHQRIHTGEKPFSCADCGKSFTKKSNLVEHQRIHTGEKPFSCFECEKCFARKSELFRHERSHHTGKRLFSCSVCGNRFTQKSDLMQHQSLHTAQKWYSCTECGKCFTWKYNLVKHQRVHTGEKPFPCSECGKCFTKKCNLDEHQKIHAGEKPFSCSNCGKCFTSKSNLVTHLRIHTGEKPFSCSQCGKCYTRKANLVEHQRVCEKPL
ncbi:oocyte zinc finger protein XlCOF8.4-like [Bufo gargarizans]|uniref:oocyte zinc finger protein XlCOF8.4-like n=1 Tax=Bufo gargarizans TaxID=30331 RepID=UPI001CF5E31F|nr:oocyte zinc finger protein XlCOF8.4-like [Bufo gargarizans]